MKYFEHTVEAEDLTGKRIDIYIANVLKLFSRSQLKRCVKKVLLNGKECKLGKKVFLNDHLKIFYDDPPPLELLAENIQLNIVYENENVIVINKNQNMVVHPGCGNRTGTLVNALLFYNKQLKDNFNKHEIRPGIVHRLDKDTSGLIIVAKNPEANEFLSNQFRKSRVKKNYLAIVKGQPSSQQGMIDTNIHRDKQKRKRFKVTEDTGKRAITYYRIIKSLHNYSLVLLRPKTGRTHQLRVHMKYLRCPILGDPIYTRPDHRFRDATMMLHAYKLKIKLPGHSEMTEFKTPIPKRFVDILKKLNT